MRNLSGRLGQAAAPAGSNQDCQDDDEAAEGRHGNLPCEIVRCKADVPSMIIMAQRNSCPQASHRQLHCRQQVSLREVTREELNLDLESEFRGIRHRIRRRFMTMQMATVGERKLSPGLAVLAAASIYRHLHQNCNRFAAWSVRALRAAQVHPKALNQLPSIPETPQQTDKLGENTTELRSDVHINSSVGMLEDEDADATANLHCSRCTVGSQESFAQLVRSRLEALRRFICQGGLS